MHKYAAFPYFALNIKSTALRKSNSNDYAFKI